MVGKAVLRSARPWSSTRSQTPRRCRCSGGSSGNSRSNGSRGILCHDYFDISANTTATKTISTPIAADTITIIVLAAMAVVVVVEVVLVEVVVEEMSKKS